MRNMKEIMLVAGVGIVAAIISLALCGIHEGLKPATNYQRLSEVGAMNDSIYEDTDGENISENTGAIAKRD